MRSTSSKEQWRVALKINLGKKRGIGIPILRSD